MAYDHIHLENQKKVWLEQEDHFKEINIWLKKTYLAHNPDPFADLKEDIEEEIEKLDPEAKRRLKKIKKDFQNPLGDI